MITIELNLLYKASTKIRKTIRRPQFWFGLAVLGPISVWYILFAFSPIIEALFVTFTNYKIMDPAGSPFVGLQNFQTVFEFSLFWIGLKNSVIYSLAMFIIMIPLALLISLCINTVSRGQSIYRFFVFMPAIVSFVAISLLFKTMLDPQIGLINDILSFLGLPTSQFLTGVDSALATVIGIDIWRSVGFYVILLSAGLLNIPSELYDASKVDGVNSWQQFWFMTLPLIGHTLALVCVLNIMGGLQVFGTPYVLTEGGPNYATYTLNMLIYFTAFSNLQFSLATATAFILFVLTLVVTVIQLRLLRPNWSY